MSAELPPIPWRGFWTTLEHPQQHPMSLQVKRTPEGIEADGTDEVGTFTLKGTLGTGEGTCGLTKKYVEKHEVRYDARPAGEGLVGRWFIQDVCGGAFALWPGVSPAPSAELLAAVPKVEGIPRSTRWALAGLDLGILFAGLAGLVMFAKLSTLRAGFYLGCLLFVVFMLVAGFLQKRLIRRIVRQRFGPLAGGTLPADGSLRDSLKKTVSWNQVLIAVVSVAVMLYTAWLFQQKRRS